MRIIAHTGQKFLDGKVRRIFFFYQSDLDPLFHPLIELFLRGSGEKALAAFGAAEFDENFPVDFVRRSIFFR